jgi:hypothetical protein
MHEIARDRVTFVTRDFREPIWPGGLGTFDALVTLQAAHETVTSAISCRCSSEHAPSWPAAVCCSTPITI